MEPYLILSQIKSLLARAPSFDTYTPSSLEHQVWLGQAHALVVRWNSIEAITLKTASDFLGFEANRALNVAQIFGILHRAVADLELRLPKDPGQSFGPGAVYDFFKALNGVISSAQKSLLIADPYMDETVFDTYLSSVGKGIAVRLLVERYSAKVKPAAEKFVGQYGALLEVRSSSDFHDRLLFVDDDVCWVVGQSIKDAAAAKPTYLASLSADLAKPKLAHYERIWLQATAI